MCACLIESLMFGSCSSDFALNPLKVAAEDYCADVGATRTPSRMELLYARSSVVTAAKAYKLSAIDM